MYADALKSTNPAKLKAEQKVWLKGRNRCADVVCIQAAYRQRTGALSQASPPPAPAAQPDPPIQTQLAQAATEPACLPPKIDWHNYQWTLITGNGMTACEEMLAYLKSRPKEAPPPVCPDERLPPNGNWMRPDWKEPDVAQREGLLKALPVEFKKHHVWGGRQEILKIARTDITRDGVPETLLAYGSRPGDCKRPVRCADEKGFISLHEEGEDQDLMPMDDAGSRLDLDHRAMNMNVGHGFLWFGELIYYRSKPYWLSTVTWSQQGIDGFRRYPQVTNDHYSRIFELAPLEFLTHGAGYKRGGPVSFTDVHAVLPDENATCHFGYFHRDNLKINPPKTRR